MDENAKARDLEAQATMTRQPGGPATGPGARTSLAPQAGSCEPADDELDLLRGKAAGHRWDGWRRLTGDEVCVAACSCGWRSTETGSARWREGRCCRLAIRASRTLSRVAAIVAGSFASGLIIVSGMGCSHATAGSAGPGGADGSSDGAPSPEGSTRRLGCCRAVRHVLVAMR